MKSMLGKFISQINLIFASCLSTFKFATTSLTPANVNATDILQLALADFSAESYIFLAPRELTEQEPEDGR